MKETRKIFIYSLFLLLIFLAVSSACFAEETNKYVLIQPLPVEGLEGGQPVSLSTYVDGMIKIGIVTAAVLAVVMIVIAGFMYITAGGSSGTIDKAKDYIWGAIIGLLIAVSYWLILTTINPQMKDVNIAIPPVSIPDNCVYDPTNPCPPYTEWQGWPDCGCESMGNSCCGCYYPVSTTRSCGIGVAHDTASCLAWCQGIFTLYTDATYFPPKAGVNYYCNEIQECGVK